MVLVEHSQFERVHSSSICEFLIPEKYGLVVTLVGCNVDQEKVCRLPMIGLFQRDAMLLYGYQCYHPKDTIGKKF